MNDDDDDDDDQVLAGWMDVMDGEIDGGMDG